MDDAAAIDALAAKVDELAGTCARLSEENVCLRNQITVLAGGLSTASDNTTDSFGPRAAQSAGLTGRAQLSRRAVGVALAGAAAGIIGGIAASERTNPRAETLNHPVTAESAPAELASAEFAAAEQTTPSATTSSSVLNAQLSTTSSVVSATNLSTGPGVSGAGQSTGPGVYGANSSTGPGVKGSSSHGRGGIFAGPGAAQVQLAPGSSTHPQSGQMGDLYADSTGRLWFCKKTGTTATWHQIA
jgi:hypothetical protein